MKVRSETVIQNRTISVEVADEDVAHDVPGWESKKLATRFRILSANADRMVVFYLGQQNLIDPETMKKRLDSLNIQLKAAMDAD